jgi:hypothetical protein
MRSRQRAKNASMQSDRRTQRSTPQSSVRRSQEWKASASLAMHASSWQIAR